MNILRNITKDKTIPNILSASVHERYEHTLSSTNFNFYNLIYEGCKPWRECFAPIPSNYHFLNYIPRDLDFDCVLSHTKFGQFQILSKIAKEQQVPLISLEHTAVPHQWGPLIRQQVKDMRGDLNVFISSYSVESWGFELSDPTVRIIHHGVNTDIFKPNSNIEKQNRILSVANDYVGREYALNYTGFRRVTEGLPVHIVGDTPGVSLPSKSVEDLVEQYNSSQIFINTSVLSPIPSVILEAMSCGLPIISTDNCAIPEFVKNEKGGFLTNSESEMKKYLKILLADKDLCEKMGAFNYNYIRENFSQEKFVENWKRTIREVL